MARQSEEERRLDQSATIREVQFIVDAAIAVHYKNAHGSWRKRLRRRLKKQRTVADISKVLDMAQAAAKQSRDNRPGFDAAGHVTKPSIVS